MNKMNIQTFRIADLNPAKYNPRKELKPGDPEFEKLKKSIQTFGYVELIVVNVANHNTVISGHQRLNVLKALNETEAECVAVELNEADEKALNIAMNKVNGQWDEEKLAECLDELQKMDYQMELTGFDPPEIEQLMSQVYDKDVEEDDFDVDAELEKPAVTQKGDLWLLGKHRLICADSTLPETYDILMDGRKANLVVTDPPYNVNYEGTAGKIKNDKMAEDKFEKFLFAAYVNMEQNMEDDASIYVFHSDSHGLAFRKAFEDAGFYLSGCCIWKKQSLVLGRSPYQWQHEPVLFGWKKSGKHEWYADRKQSTIWEYDRPAKNDLHPTMKPVALVAYPIRNSSMQGCVVLDPFGGSGSTLIACEETRRVCYTAELDEKYADVIVERFIQYTGTNENVRLIRDGKEIPYREIKSPELSEN